MSGQARHLDHPFLPLPFFVARDSVDAAIEVDVLLDRKVLVERELLAHVADVGFDPFGLRADVEASDGAASAAGGEDSTQHADRRRFAGAVGTEKSEDFAAGNLEAHVVDGRETTESLLQVFHDDG